MQALSFSSARWEPPQGTLGELSADAVRRAELVEGDLANLRARAADQRPAVPFSARLRGDTIGVIAEVKRASPSKGMLASGIDAAQRAALYAAGGAAAISVLTEPSRFGGSLADLAEVATAVTLPVIRKDFLVAPVQLWEARANGASVVLLIVRALSPELLRRLVDGAHEAGLETLIEVRDEHELDRALAVQARVIGVNNRNLETLVIDPSTAPRLIARIPDTVVAVAESGMQCTDDVAPAARAGADAILVGSALSSAADPAAAVRQLASIPRRARAVA